MAGWVNRIVDSRSGDDRSTWTKGYESSWYEYDRVGAGSIWVENFAVSIYGNMQPAVFRRHAKSLSQDGLIQRFIPGILDSKLSRVNYPIPDAFSCRQQWDQTIRTIYTLPAMTYRLSPGAYEVYREFQHWYHDTKLEETLLDAGDDTQDGYMTAFGKLEGQCGRLALVLHLIEMPWCPEVSEDLMRRTVAIVKGYLVPALRYLLGEVSGLLEDSLEAWVTKHILAIASAVETTTLREIKRAARRKLDSLSGLQELHKNNLIIDAMEFLQKCQWVALIESNPNRSHYVWQINPELANQFRIQREAMLKAKQKRLDETLEQISERVGKEIPRQLVRGYDASLDD